MEYEDEAAETVTNMSNSSPGHSPRAPVDGKGVYQEEEEEREEEEARWVDAAEADRWEQEQARRWTGAGVGSFPDA